MTNYRRPDVTGGTIFFTVCLADRRSDLLVREVDRLREVVRQSLTERPVDILAWVVLPDHMHCVWRLPRGDKAFGQRWGVIKSRFSRGLLKAHGWDRSAMRRATGRMGLNPILRVEAAGSRGLSPSKVAKGDAGIWQRRFWEHHCRSEEDVAACVRYCHLNAVKHGFVARAEDWQWSSVHREVKAGRWGGG